MSETDEQQVAELIAVLRPVPAGWVRAAQELPSARRALDTLIARAQASAGQRQAILEDIEASLRAEGVEPSRALVGQLKQLLD
ncbi:MAG TPA: hypothetical protein VHV75_19365 [Solirubrobacteraceae bacterium]|jgi:hypothetical protein|nr:hypothetical protein [Solirubrobacteraceae bacterium]